MDEQRQLLFVNQFLPSNEQKLIDRLREAANRRITRPPEVTAALRNVPIDTVAEVVIGPSYIGVLYTDGQIGRLPYVATSRPLAPSASPAKAHSTAAAAPGGGATGGSGAPSGGGAPSAGGASSSAHGSLISRTAKFRRDVRVMLATSSGGGRGGRDHRSVIIDRARPMLPASAVPEELIAQAQVVLQGKSREVIIRELQRTNLNVNEAVNNLLSRDDDDDEGSEGADMCIPEELLTLLDSSHGVLESDLYPADSFEYLLSSRERRNKADKDKEKQKSSKPVIESNSDTEALRRYEIPTGSISEPWEGVDNKLTALVGTPRFTHIACTQSELLAIATDNRIYGWKWSEARGDINAHPMYGKLKLADGETLTHLVACSLRVAVMTSYGRMASWLDTVGCGERLSEALFVPPQKLSGHECFEQLIVSNQLAVARCANNVFHWCGLYPVNDRRSIFEKARTKQRKHVTFDTTQIVVGSEVRTKSGPIYSIGCIAANLTGPTPMIGILMENAWSLSEVCRFRLLDPAAYDADRYHPAAAAAPAAADAAAAEDREAAVGQQALASGNRKRPATEEVFAAEPKQREEPWPIADVIFIHEEVQNDTAIVTIVDGGYCAVEYQEAVPSPTDAFATNVSKQLASKGDKDKPMQKARLIRKDELTVVSHKMRYARSPNSMRVEPYRFVLSGSTATKRVISAVADSLGIRALVERRGVAYIVRISVRGKTLTSHSLPLHAPSLHCAAAAADGVERKPLLMNYGDDSILLLRDANGGIIPLVRDAAAGFKEPTYLQLPASSVTALAVKSAKDKDRPSWAPKANREAVILTLQGTHPRTLERRLPSLLHTVMCCDDKAVKALLDALHNEGDLELSKREIADARADGNRNALHAAVMNAYASKNALEADVESPVNVLTTSESRSSADQVRAALDKKWNDLLKTRSSQRAASNANAGAQGPATAAAATDAAQPAADAAAAAPESAPATAPDDIVIVPESQVPAAGAFIKVEVEDNDQPPPLLVQPSPVENPKMRQENAIAIVKMLVTHPICIPFLADLLGGRDIHGQTPFMAAVNHRAYSAARTIFKAIKSLFVEGDSGKFDAEHLLPFIFPAGARPDDSPLFILCYNDTCSFTWTGDEHINQDIFECRTCGLTGSLCCCTECAFTCHRNHDCKLKRTSPTAYCDCWEKACCKALVSGNQHAREALLIGLITKSNLYTMLNGRGEHVLLYLARKLARQSSEQWNYTRRPRRIQPPPSARDSSIPEHDLEPPRFARTALMFCLRNWSVVRSLAMIGVRQMHQSVPMAEELFHLNAQHGSSHLDKFMLIMLTKCSDESNLVLESLLRVLTEQHNRARVSGENLEEVNFVISRFVRSVARLFIMAVVVSSVAASTAVSGLVLAKESGSSSLLDRPTIRGITFSGIFGHLRKDTSKDSKLKNMGMLIVRCKVFFEHFAVFTLHEMAQLADAALAPVRTGILRPCVNLAALLGSAADSIENLEKYINSEPDLTQHSSRSGAGLAEMEAVGGEQRREAKKRRKRSSRRDTDRDEAPSESVEGGGAAAPAADSSDSDSDSDSDGDGPSSRRHASQSSALAANEEPSAGNNQEPPAREARNWLDESDSQDTDDEEVESESEGERRDEEEDEEEEEDAPIEDAIEDDAEMDYDATSEEPATAGDESRGDEDREERRASGASRASRPGRDEAAAARGDEDDEESSRRFNAYGERRYDFRESVVDRGSSDGEGSVSSPEYSSVSEGEGVEPQRGSHRERRRRRKTGAASAADAADAAAAVAASAAGVAVNGLEMPSAQGEQANVDVGEPAAREERDDGQREEDVVMADEEVAVEIFEPPREEEEREGSARTRLFRREDPRNRGGTGAVAAMNAVREVLEAADSASGAAAAAAAAVDEDSSERSDAEIASRLLSSGRGGSVPSVRRVMQSARLGGPANSAGPGRQTARRRDGPPPASDAERPSNSSRRNAIGDVARSSRGGGGGERGLATRGGYTGGPGAWAFRRAVPPWMSRSSMPDSDRRQEGRDTTGAGSGSSSGEEKKADAASGQKEDETPTTFKAGIQLAAAFSFAVRVIGELLPMVAAGYDARSLSVSPNARIASLRDVEQLNDMEEAVRRRAIDHVGARLEDSWRWLAVVLDHAEAQIKYINAVSSTEEARKKESREKKRSGARRKSPARSELAAITAAMSSPPLTSTKVKRETIACLLGVLRAHSGEAGDDTPLVDLETLRAPALVVDAYLGFVEAKAEAETLFEQRKKDKDAAASTAKDGSASPDKSGDEEIVGLRRFYQRSNSVSFPGASFTDAHDTLQLPCGQSLPIVERPQLLTSTVEKEVIFGPPPSTQERTREEHDKVIRSHGVSHPHNQSLTAAPVSSHRLFVAGDESRAEEGEEGEERMDTESHAVQPIAPVVIPAVASAPANLHEMGEEPAAAEEADKEREDEEGSRSKRSSPRKTPGRRGRKRTAAKGGEKESAPPDDDASGASSGDVIFYGMPKKRKAAADDQEDELQQQLVVVAPPPTPISAPAGFEKVTYEEILETFKTFREHPLRKLMGRWRFALQLIAKELSADLMDTLGGELAGSRLLRELAGFEMKQHELRARMEKYRASATKDLAIEVHRDAATLVRETCYQLNRTFTRRVALRGTEAGGGGSGGARGPGPLNAKKEEPLPPLASHKVKVKFTDEPGEGTGVARSYYTALAEALASLRSLPFTDYGYTAGNDEYLYGGPMPAGTPASSSNASGGRRIQLIRDRNTFYATVTSSSSSASGRRRLSSFDRRMPLNFMHPPYTPQDMAAAEALNVAPDFLMDLREDTYVRREGGSGAEKLPTELTDRLFILIRGMYPAAAARLTGMFMDLPLSHIILVLGDHSALRAYLGDAIDSMMANAAPTDVALLRGEDEKKDLAAATVTSTEADDAPLFFRPSKKAHYSPVPGRMSPARMSAFRNVGRVIGICLMQCEMFPLRLSRHVLKYILGRPLNWHDFAFYDPQMFESLRKLIVEGCSAPDHAQFFDALQMTFSIDMPPEATGMPSSTLELIPGGADVLVTKENIIEYVYRFVEARLLGATNGRCLAAIRQGVQDVIPQAMLDNLTAEDLRLVLCGTETVSLSLMQSYTAWTDESHAAPETIAKFKQWFWQVAERLSPAEKQDLIFFWTGAPSLPSTEEGFQPLPTIVIRPTDDGFLPTANTCISRLYMPLYNSKKTLTAKLQLAIKAKNFGFV